MSPTEHDYLSDKELTALGICLKDGGTIFAREAACLIAAARKWNECRRSWRVDGVREPVPGGDANG